MISYATTLRAAKWKTIVHWFSFYLISSYQQINVDLVSTSLSFVSCKTYLLFGGVCGGYTLYYCSYYYFDYHCYYYYTTTTTTTSPIITPIKTPSPPETPQPHTTSPRSLAGFMQLELSDSCHHVWTALKKEDKKREHLRLSSSARRLPEWLGSVHDGDRSRGESV